MPSRIEARTPEAARRVVQRDAVFRAAADQAPLVMWIVNAKGAVTYLNHCWYELVGGTPPKWYGHEWADVVHPDDVAQMRERWRKSSKDGTVFEGTRRVLGQDGAWHTLSYRAMPVFDASGLACWVGMDSDITEMVRTQAALRSANDELEGFSRALSHDLRSPMVTVQGFSRLIQGKLSGDDDPQLRHYVERLTGAVRHMEQLVEGLGVLARIKREDLRLDRVDISALSTEILERLRLADPDRSVNVDVAPAIIVWGDASLLAVLLENLLGNAWKFTARVPQARIEVRMVPGTVHEDIVLIRDNGAGFDLPRATRLFQAFERFHSHTEFPGTGIGLATVGAIAARHRGRVWAESAVDEGSTFYFALPRGAAGSAK